MNQKTKTITSLLVVFMFWIWIAYTRPETTHWTFNAVYIFACICAGYNCNQSTKNRGKI